MIGSRTKTQLGRDRVSEAKNGIGERAHALRQFDGESHDAPSISHGLTLV